MRTLRNRRGSRLGQGMSEYIIIVGLIAIFLIFAVRLYGDTVDTAIQGTDGRGGAVGATRDVEGAIESAGGTGNGATFGNGTGNGANNGGSGTGNGTGGTNDNLGGDSGSLGGGSGNLGGGNTNVGSNPGAGGGN